jgi:hypothetical protein
MMGKGQQIKLDNIFLKKLAGLLLQHTGNILKSQQLQKDSIKLSKLIL